MEENYYLCRMLRDLSLTYFNNIIAGLDAPEGSFMSLSSYIGSSNSHSSISNFIKNKTKSVGPSLNGSMSRFLLSQITTNSDSNVQTNNYRPELHLGMAKLHFVRTECIPNYW
jgi:hypothetical protein